MNLIEEIGFIAGDIYQTLLSGETEVDKLKKTLSKDEKLVLLGLGWLAREGKVAISKDKRKIKVKVL